MTVAGPVPTLSPVVDFPWSSQVMQYDTLGRMGISLFIGELGEEILPVLCLCWRDERGLLRGVLNYYQENNYWENKGNANLFVDPEWYGKGIGTALLLEAMNRWQIDFQQQKYTKQGASFVARLIEKGQVVWPVTVP